VIYYTLNGTKPEPFRTVGSAAKSTLLYQGPFVLPPGKRTVKAVAVTRLVDLAARGLCLSFNFCQMVGIMHSLLLAVSVFSLSNHAFIKIFQN